MILFASGESQPMVLGSAPAINQHEDRVALSLQTRVEELCESRGGRPGLSVLTSIMVSVDVKQY